MTLKIDSCLKLSEVLRIAGYFITIVKIVVPILLILLIIKDWYQSIVLGEKNHIHKNISQTIKRLIAGLIVFMIPTLIPFLFSYLINGYDDSSAKICNTCLFYPSSKNCENQINEYTNLQQRLEDIDVMGKDFYDTTFDDVGEAYARKITEEAKQKGKKVSSNANEYGTKDDFNTNEREKSNGTREEVLASAEKMSKRVEKDVQSGIKWYYSNKGCKGSFEKAEADEVYKTNCALGVVWILKSAGVLNQNQGFYNKNGEHAISGSMSEEDIQKTFNVVEANGAYAKDLIKDGTLEAGDVVLWYEGGHTNMYAGNNSWYDTGRNFTGGYGTMDEYYFKTFGPVKITFYEESRVWRILKIK